ncbi:hypothetical protein FB107DRAFT_246304 [Schizophyllum commune]
MHSALVLTLLFSLIHLFFRALEAHAGLEMIPIVGAGALMVIFAVVVIALFIWSHSPTVVLRSCEKIYQEAREALVISPDKLEEGKAPHQRYNEQLTYDSARKALDKLDADMGEMITRIRALHQNRTLRAIRALSWTWAAMNLRDALRDAREDTRSLCPLAHPLSKAPAGPLLITDKFIEGFKVLISSIAEKTLSG